MQYPLHLLYALDTPFAFHCCYLCLLMSVLATCQGLAIFNRGYLTKLVWHFIERKVMPASSERDSVLISPQS